jgi:hypothetical protein
MRIISRAESWEKVYEAFEQINFSAFDYNTIKESIIDYLKLYFSEDFNDWIESSELLPIIEAFAYVGEILAYRLDLNAHENLISVAQRKESVLRLAKLLSYNASRNIPSRGLVKITNISTTENVFDSNNNNLNNKTIRWNDPNNSNWKEQFILILNRILKQNFGTVLPTDRIQVQDVIFELYELDNNPLINNVLKYNINVSNVTYGMELVSSDLSSFGPVEKRPEKDLKLSILYLSDGLGDSSDNTGFFFFTKQGQLQRKLGDFDGVTPNQTFDIDIENCNETDVWINNIDPDTEEILNNSSDIQTTERTGEWQPVELASAQNIIFNTSANRNKYEIETLNSDKFRIIFGDGNFANIPSGRFEIWFRISANEELSIPISAIQNIANNLTYQDSDNKEQTLSFTMSLINPIQNSAPTEDIERIRKTAPAVYYTQDRMVNGRDYNEFMLQDNSILKLRSINRTFSGDSKYIYWHDPREYYENVKIFGNDLVIYFNNITNSFIVDSSELPPITNIVDSEGFINGTTISALLNNFIEPLLTTDLFFTTFTINGLHPQNIRRFFTDEENLELKESLSIISVNSPNTIYLNYTIIGDNWEVYSTEPSTWWISIESRINNEWNIEYNGINIIVHSDDTKFWITNDENRIITTDTLNTNLDEIIILSANLNFDGEILNSNRNFSVIRQLIITEGEYVGSESIHDLEVLPKDIDNDGFPDDVDLNYLIGDNDYVYFNRTDAQSPWIYQQFSQDVFDLYVQDQSNEDGLWKRERGRENLNFLWMHRTPRYNLIDPAPSNIIDTFIISRGYYTSMLHWLRGSLEEEPESPVPFTLRADYNYLLDNKMISDTIILHPGKIKPIIGNLAKDTLQAVIKIIRSKNSNITTNQLKTKIVDLIYEFFDINKWEFGETFYFTELSAFIHSRLPIDLDSIVFVPKFNNHIFGDLYQVLAKEDEIIQPTVGVDDIQIIESINSKSIKQTL